MTERPLDETTTPECRQALAELFGFLDGEIGTEDRERVSEHLDRCSDCLEAFEFHHELRVLIAERCRADVPDDLKGRILDALAGLGDSDPEG